MDYFELVRALDYIDRRSGEPLPGVTIGFEPAATHHADPLKALVALTTAIPVKQPKPYR